VIEDVTKKIYLIDTLVGLMDVGATQVKETLIDLPPREYNGPDSSKYPKEQRHLVYFPE
jgi:hypothetical protein